MTLPNKQVEKIAALADEAERRADANARSAELWRTPLDPFFDRVAAVLRSYLERNGK